MPRDVPCQISYCWFYHVAPFPRNDQNLALLRPKHGPHMVLQIGSSQILIIVPRYIPCQISHCWVYPVAPFPKNGQNMALLWPKHGPHMVLQIGSSWILINVPRDAPCQISGSWHQYWQIFSTFWLSKSVNKSVSQSLTDWDVEQCQPQLGASIILHSQN